MNKQHGLLFKMLCICLATVLMVGSTAVVSFADDENSYTFLGYNEDGIPMHLRTYKEGDETKTEKERCTFTGSQGTVTEHEGKCQFCKKTITGYHVLKATDATEDGHTGPCQICHRNFESRIAHEYMFKNNKDGTHTVKCPICNFEDTHTSAITDNKDGTHTIECEKCPYKETGFHSGLTVNDKGEHTGKCNVCGQDVTVSGHHFDEDTVKSYATYHEVTCVFCGTTLKDSHTFNYIYQGNADAQFHYCTVCGKEGTHVFTKWENKDSVSHYCVKCDGCKLDGKNEQIVAPHDWKEKTIKERTLFKDGEKAQKCWQCGAVQEGSSEEIPSVIKSIGLWIVGAFGFVGHVAYEPIRWIVKLFDDTPPKD